MQRRAWRGCFPEPAVVWWAAARTGSAPATAAPGRAFPGTQCFTQDNVSIHCDFKEKEQKLFLDLFQDSSTRLTQFSVNENGLWTKHLQSPPCADSSEPPRRLRCARVCTRRAGMSVTRSPRAAASRQNLGGRSDKCPRLSVSGQLGSDSP